MGSLSLMAFIPLLLTGRTDRRIYRSRDMRFRHQWASIWDPLILAVLVAIYQSQYTPTPVRMLLVVSSGYLAWHVVWFFRSSGFAAGLGDGLAISRPGRCR